MKITFLCHVQRMLIMCIFFWKWIVEGEGKRRKKSCRVIYFIYELCVCGLTEKNENKNFYFHSRKGSCEDIFSFEWYLIAPFHLHRKKRRSRKRWRRSRTQKIKSNEWTIHGCGEGKRKEKGGKKQWHKWRYYVIYVFLIFISNDGGSNNVECTSLCWWPHTWRRGEVVEWRIKKSLCSYSTHINGGTFIGFIIYTERKIARAFIPHCWFSLAMIIFQIIVTPCVRFLWIFLSFSPFLTFYVENIF